MLDKLPSELIDHILLLVARFPIEWPYSLCRWWHSHNVLLDTSLVLKRVKEHSQALLWQEVFLHTDNRVDALISVAMDDDGKDKVTDRQPLHNQSRLL
jgi:hypothetical protein